MRKLLLLSLTTGIWSLTAQATIYYVDGTKPDNASSGTSWAAAKKDVQEAINLATVVGDEVWVKAGTYLPTLDNTGNAAPSNNRTKTFYLTATDIKLYGGFAGTEVTNTQRDPSTNVTTLSGDLDGAGGTADAYHVLYTTGRSTACLINGFTITGGRATGAAGINGNTGGGMLNLSASSPTVTACTFSSNTSGTTSSSNGAGVANYANCNPVFAACTFSNNTSNGYGGAIYNSNNNLTLTNCTFSSNTGNSSGGIYMTNGNLTIDNCTFNNNTTPNSGGAISTNNTTVVISNSIFDNNSTTFTITGGGGAVYNNGNSLILTSCVFSNNRLTYPFGGSGTGGGAVYNVSTNSTISNCTFYGNNSSDFSGIGGGITYKTGTTGISSGGTLTNCIFYSNTTSNNSNNPNRVEIYKDDVNALLTVSYCIIDDYSATATNNYTSGPGITTTNPTFINTASPAGPDGIFRTADDGLRIGCSSVAKDAGSATATANDSDIIGNRRQGTIDIGAYEAQGGTSASNTLPITTTAVAISQPSGTTAAYTDCTAQLVTLASNGTSPLSGSAVARTFVQPATLSTTDGRPYVRRYYDITPAANANTATATVTLYFTQADFDDYNANNGSYPDLPTGVSDAAGKAALRVTQQHGTSASGLLNTYTYTGSGAASVLIDPVDANIVYNSTAARWEVSFDVTGFSGFFVNSGTTNPLPIRLLSFAAQAQATGNLITWQVANQEKGTTYTVARSGDGDQFVPISEAVGKEATANYTQLDEHPLAGTNYYRLRITDASGRTSYSSVTSVRRAGVAGQNGGVSIAPIPTTHSLHLTNTDPSLNGTRAVVSNIQGGVIYTLQVTADQTIDVDSWAVGIYTLHLANGAVIRLVKQ